MATNPLMARNYSDSTAFPYLHDRLFHWEGISFLWGRWTDTKLHSKGLVCFSVTVVLMGIVELKKLLREQHQAEIR
jgi:hypothetical protein